MTRRIRLFGSYVVALLMLAAACAAPAAAPTATPTSGKPVAVTPTAAPAATPAAATGEPYTIGAVFDITGPASSLGVPERNTAQMLEKEINAKGGIKGPDGKLHLLNIKIYDNQSQETQSVLVTKKLIEEDKVPVIVGPSQTGTTMALIDTIEKAKVPLISCAASYKIVEPVAQRQWVFKTPQSDSLVVSVLDDYLKAKGITKVGWLSVNNAFGDSGREEFEKAAPKYGITITDSEKFGAEDKDMTAQLTKIKASNPQAVVIWAIPPGAATAAKNARDLGLTIPIFESHGIANKAFIDLAGPAANGVTFPAGKLLIAKDLPDTDPQKKVLLAYAQGYQAAFNQPANTFGGHAWDALQIAVKAMEKAGPDPAKIRAEIENIKNFVGITGVFNFSPQDHNGLDKRAVSVIEIKNGAWVPAPGWKD